MMDVDKFIKCVRSNPAIWDMRCDQYLLKSAKTTSWMKICKSMFKNWAALSDEDKDNNLWELKKKWRHLRDNYFKQVAVIKSGKGGKRKKYLYAQVLSFLDQMAPKRRVRRTPRQQKVEESEEEEEEEEEEESDSKENVVIPEVMTVPIVPYALPDPLQIEEVSSAPVEPPVRIVQRPVDNSDADKEFLLSLLPDYRRLTYEQKIDFRIHALVFFRDIVSRAQVKTEDDYVDNLDVAPMS